MLKKIIGLIAGLILFFVLDALSFIARFWLDSIAGGLKNTTFTLFLNVVIFLVPLILSIFSGLITYIISGRNKLFGYITFGLTFIYVLYLWLIH